MWSKYKCSKCYICYKLRNCGVLGGVVIIRSKLAIAQQSVFQKRPFYFGVN